MDQVDSDCDRYEWGYIHFQRDQLRTTPRNGPKTLSMWEIVVRGCFGMPWHSLFAIAERLFSSKFSAWGAFGLLAFRKTPPNGENLPFDSLEVAQLAVCPS